MNNFEIIQNFKGTNLKDVLDQLSKTIKEKGHNSITHDIFQIHKSALEIKKLSTQIDEIVHASGIILSLPKILLEGEKVEELSLASGSSGEGIDLVTNKRIAEFKFARWQDFNSNGMRKRQVFADLVKLYLNDEHKMKELYVYNADKIIKFFSSEKATWKNVLSKSGHLIRKLEKHLIIEKAESFSLNDIYQASNVKIIDLDIILP